MMVSESSRHAERRMLYVPVKKLPETFDPQNIVTIFAVIATLQIHRGLMRMTSDLDVALDAASSVDTDAAGLAHVFDLADRRFSDGTKLTAVHVKLTFDRMMHKKIGLGEDFNYVESVEAVSENRVKFVLKNASAIFHVHLACPEAAILPLRTIDDVVNESTPGLGPYRVVTLKRSELNLEAVDGHVGLSEGSPRLIRFEPVHEADFMTHPNRAQFDSIEGYALNAQQRGDFETQGMTPTVTAQSRQMFLVLNPHHLTLDERQYIQSKVATTPLSGSLIEMGGMSKAKGLIPPSLRGMLRDWEPETISRAVPREKKVLKFPLATDQSDFREVGLWLEELLSEQFFVDIEPITLEDHMKRIDSPDWSIFVRSKFLDYPDGLSVLAYFKTGVRPNSFYVNSKSVDDLIDESSAELDPNKRAALFERIQIEILNEATIAPILFGTSNQGLWNTSKLSVPSHPLGLQGLPLETVTFK